MYLWEWVDQWDAESDYDDFFTEVAENQSEVGLSETKMEDGLHTVAFKCIGASRDAEQQRVLKLVHNLLESKEHVLVKLEPEPSNPFDAHAIAFMTYIEEKWQRIGYVVREVLKDVHNAMASGNIVEVKYAWIKYLLSFPKSGPGYYAAINITCRGEWSRVVVASCSRVK